MNFLASDSPMVLDSTIEEVEESTPLDRESIITTVPEYAKEIYSYLREAEVFLHKDSIF